MAIPVLGSAAVDLYDAVQPLAYADEDYDYALAKYCGTLGELLQKIDTYVRDTDTHVGWGQLLDPDVAPVEALQWLGQFAGVQPEPRRQSVLYTNYIKNPSFEINLSHWSQAGSGTSVRNRDSSVVTPYGQAAQRIATDGTFSGQGANYNDSNNGIVVIPGETWTVFGYALGSAGGESIRVVVEWKTAADANISFSNGSNVILSTGEWLPVLVTGVAPATAAKIYARFATTSAVVVTYWLDGCVAVKQPGIVPYFDGDQPGGRWQGAAHDSISDYYQEEDESGYWDRQRVRIKDKLGFERGTRDAMVNAAKSWLTGSKAVYFNERDTSPYHLTVSTKADETPDPAGVAAALQAQKPAGLVMVVQQIAGQDWNNLVSTRTDWTDVGAAYASWQAEING